MNYDVGPIWNQIDEMDFGIQHIAVPLEVVKSVCPVSAYKVRHMVTNPAGEASHAGDSFLVAREHLEHVLSGAFTIDLDSPVASISMALSRFAPAFLGEVWTRLISLGLEPDEIQSLPDAVATATSI